MHLSKLIERVEQGERITISRNNRTVALVSPIDTTPASILARIDVVRERNGGCVIRKPSETWRDFVEDGRRV